MRLKQFLIAAINVITFASISSSVFAGAVTSKEEIAISTTGGGISVNSSNGNSFKLGGRIMYDYDYYDGAYNSCLLYTSPSPRDATLSRMPSSA